MIEPDNIAASSRLGSPGPCTPKAHCWDAGCQQCNCGEEWRSKSVGWRVASKLTDAAILAILGVS